MLQATTAGFCLVDRQYQVLRHNRVAVTLYKKLTGTLLHAGLDLVSGIIEERKNTARRAVDTAFLGGVTEYEVLYTVPEHVWVKARYSAAFDEAGHCTGVCLCLEDITAKKELEEKAHRRELKFLSLFNFSSIGMSLVAPGGKLLDVNPALAKMLGYSREELMRLTFQEITYAADLGPELEYDRQVLSRKIETYQMEKRYYHKNGGIVWAILTVSMVWLTDGSPGFFIGQVVDITPVKTMIKELEAKNHSLDFAAHDLEEKIQQLEEFTHMVGHNLRGPVANISSMAGLLMESAPEELPVWLGRLQQTADSLLSTLTELLAYSQVKLAKGIAFEDCDIRSLCDDTLTQVAGTDFLHDIAVTYELRFAVMHYPKVYLQSIIYNLLSNAVKYRRADIALSITVRTDTLEGRQRLSIADNGTGFDMINNKDKIFKLNSTFHNGYNSKGIGLFITKTQVEKLGGSISVQSTPGEGTTFSIIF